MATKDFRMRVAAELSDEQLTRALTHASRTALKSSFGDCLCVRVDKSPKLSLNLKGYVQIKVDGHENKNKKVQLHQAVVWMHSDPEKRILFRHAITNKASELEISHLCRDKTCMNENHFVAEPVSANKSRNGCAVAIRIHDVVYPCCPHAPKCVPTSADLTEEKHYRPVLPSAAAPAAPAEAEHSRE